MTSRRPRDGSLASNGSWWVLLLTIFAGMASSGASSPEGDAAMPRILPFVPDNVSLTSETAKNATETASSDPVVGIPIRLPEAAGVKDPIFSILIGLVETNTYGTLTQQQLKQHLERSNKKSKLPYETVHQVTRLPQGPDHPTGEIEVQFGKDLRLPIPYSVLGYNPGSFRASQRCLFREWNLGNIVVTHREEKDGAIRDVPVTLQKAHLFGLAEGTIELDIDGWLDSMMGGNLDDTGIVGLLLCQYNDEWHGIAMGYNNDRKGRSGALSFREDKVVFPSPPEMKTIGRTMRSWVESLMASVKK